MLTTIQISKEEDLFIARLKKVLDLPSKKAVVMAGIKKLWFEHQNKVKADRLKKASLAVQAESLDINQEFSNKAYSLQNWDEN